MEFYDKIIEARDFIRKNTDFVPKIGMILGSGLGDIADDIEKVKEFQYSDIPHFPVSTVSGHAGKLVFGKLEGKDVVALKGRIHYYEGYTMKEVTFPVYLMKLLGVEQLIVTNASGGVNSAFKPGDLMLMDDHINLMGDNPLRGKNDERLGVRFPDMSNVYNKDLKEMLLSTANELGISIHRGVYTAVAGPNYETAAEVRYMGKIGGDVIGMSSAPEVIAAAHLNLKVLGISCITDVIFASTGEVHEVSHEEVLEVAAQAKPKFIKLVKAAVKKM
ncbi:MAG: purine-nucleoside phosphorylase [Armatimonadota bacterium]